MKIGSFDLRQQILIVAEIGNNHEGSLAAARKLIRLAARAGVHAVKFQTFQTAEYVTRKDRPRFQRLKSFELSPRQFARLSREARDLGLLFLSTPFDLASVRHLNGIVDAYKISSGDNTFYPLLEAVAKTGKPVLVSSGLANLKQIRRTKSFIEGCWKRFHIRQELAVLHCVSSYPVPPDQAQLLAIPALKKSLRCTIGYSDHTLGIDAAVLAAALGSRIVEKHFTLSHTYSDFRDHQLSADPEEMRQLVLKIRQAVALLGHPGKSIQICEHPALTAARRSLVAKHALRAGDRISWKDLSWVRPGTGLAPGMEKQVLGKRLTRPVRAGDLLLPETL